MATCDRIRELFSAHHDGTLHDVARSFLEQHLRGCAACRGALATFRGAMAALHECVPEPVPTAFYTALSQRVRDVRALPPRRRRLAPWLVAAAACIAMTWAARDGLIGRHATPPAVRVVSAPVERLRAGTRITFTAGSTLELEAGDVVLASAPATLTAPGVHAQIEAGDLLLVERAAPRLVWRRFAMAGPTEPAIAVPQLPPATLVRTEVAPASSRRRHPPPCPKQRQRARSRCGWIPARSPCSCRGCGTTYGCAATRRRR
ncbi:MAG: zf-HC2 domain-containing protein [Planctomycetota bacterium]